MAQNSLVIDAWLREAQEMSAMVEDLESRINNTDLDSHYRLRDSSKSKLFEVGIKLDRLESLLHNPHSKPILTKEDLEFRWNMLSEFRRRSRALALCVYASPATKRPRDLSVANHEGMSKPTVIIDEQDQSKSYFYGDDPEMHKPLISDEATSQNRAQARQSGVIITVLRTVGWIIGLIFVAAALLFLLIIICSAL